MAISLPKVVNKSKRIGRGVSRSGAKSGRGQKGQKSRAGYSRKGGFEGGQTPLYMRLPKGRGTKQYPSSRVLKPLRLNVSTLEQFSDADIVGPGVLRKAGLLQRRQQEIKLIGNGSLSKKVTVRVHSASSAATHVVEKAGGKVEIITKS